MAINKKKLILVASECMDGNKKEDRNENSLIRMAASTRKKMGYEERVEVWPTGLSGSERSRKALMLDIFQAFSKDIRKLREEGVTPEELVRVGFVTSKTFRRITGNRAGTSESIWISDSVNDVVFGADPEFLLFDGDEIIRANNVLGKAGKLGCDGAMAEVRPDPAITPEELVKNIRDIFLGDNAVSSIDGFDWKADVYHKDQSRDYPVGGHIHVGNPVQILKVSGEARDAFFSTFNKVLDELLAVPMTKLDGKEKGSNRRTGCSMGNYGYFGEWRKCNGRLEHRTLSGLWLMHPSLAKATLGVAKMIIEEVYLKASARKFERSYVLPSGLNRTKVYSSSFDDWKNVPLASDMGCLKSSAEMKRILEQSNPSNIGKSMLSGWKTSLKSFSNYREYKDYVDALHDILSLPAKAFNSFDRRIQSNWLRSKKFLVDF